MNALEKLFGLSGKTTLVTGGARGIGACVARQMAAVGSNIVIFDVLEQEAAVTAEEIAGRYGVKTAAFCCDVTDPTDVTEQLEKAVQAVGELDILFNNAGIGFQKSFLENTEEEWRRVIDVNLNGAFFMAQAFARYLVERGRPGSIINTASMSGIIVNVPQQQCSYNASKAALAHLSKSMAVELADKNIRVNSISPGYIFTDLTAAIPKETRDIWTGMIPMGRMGTPEELAGAVIYLASDSASYTNGCDLVIDGCFTVI